MKLRWGFKTEAEAITMELRGELQLGLHDRLDPLTLAEHLAIPVIGFDELRNDGASETAIRHFTGAASGDLSATTVFHGYRRLIIVNPAHAATRRASDVAHELAHTILEHEPGPAVADDRRTWSAEMEREAEWLAGCLLIPGPAALAIARNAISVEQAALQFGVGAALMTWRLNHSGATKRALREAEARRARGRR